MNNKQSIFTKYEFPLFFLLTYLLSWWAAPFTNGQLLPHGPAFAALIVIALTAGKVGLKNLWHRITQRSVAWYWFLVAPALVLGYQAAAYAITLLSGAAVANPITLPSFATLTELLLLGGMWEELGWTGYALPKLLARFAHRQNGMLIAALVLGFFRAVWHLPLFLYGHIFWFDIVFFAMAMQLLITWLFVQSGGSVIVVMLFHLTSNILGVVMYPVFDGTTRTQYYALFMGLAALLAIILVAWSFPRKSISSRPT